MKKQKNTGKIKIMLNYKSFINKKSKETILILHGWGSSSEKWTKVSEILYSSGYSVIVPDLPGFGKTKIKEAFNLCKYAECIEEFVKKLKIRNIILLGHSNGGAIATKIVLRKKISITKLILNNSAGIRNNKKRNFKKKIIGLFVKIIKKFIKPLSNSSSEKIQILRKIFYKIIGSPDYLNTKENKFLKETYLNIIKEDLGEDFKKINIKTLIIWGEKDTYTPLSDGKRINKYIKNSKIIVLKGEEHSIHIKKPEILTKAFLDESD